MDKSTKKRSTPLSRTKIPPQKFNPTPVNPSAAAHIVPRSLLQRSKSTVSSNIRSSQKKAISAECIQSVIPSKKEELSNEDLYDLTYNTYLQTCLMIAHQTKVLKEAERKSVHEVENVQSKLIILNDEINTFDIALEKINHFKQVKQMLIQKIEEYQKIKATVNEKELDDQINILKGGLRAIKLKSFKLPDTREDGEEVIRLLGQLSEELNAIPLVKNVIQPLVHARATLLKTKEYIDKEDELKKKCKMKLEKAEALAYEELCVMAFIENDKETASKEK